MASLVLVAVGLIVYLYYSGVFASFIQLSGPAQESSNYGQIVVMHVHPILKITMDGQMITIPANIGIDSSLWKDQMLASYGMPMPDMREMPFMSPLHTHDSTGVIHVESTVRRNYTLGEFFGVWGVKFDESCLLNRCVNGGGSLTVLVNGVKTGELRDLILKDREQITIEFRSGG